MPKLYLRTFGCQMNEYDSDRIADVLRAEKGMERAERPEDADLIVFNTCSVREKAQEKVFADLGRVRHLKRLQEFSIHGRMRAFDFSVAIFVVDNLAQHKLNSAPSPLGVHLSICEPWEVLPMIAP